MLCESVKVTIKTTINFYDMTTLVYFVIKEKFEKMWVIGPYFVWWQLVRHYFGWVKVGGALIWVGWEWEGNE